MTTPSPHRKTPEPHLRWRYRGCLLDCAVGDALGAPVEFWSTSCSMARNRSLAAALGGLDAIVFTAGIGDNSASLRERVCREAAWLGVALDAGVNARGGPRISTSSSRVSARVVPTNEDRMIARHTLELLDAAA